MSTPQDIYGVDGLSQPSQTSGGTTEQPSTNSTASAQQNYQQQAYQQSYQQQTYPPYSQHSAPPYQPVYYQQAPSSGCGTLLFRFALGVFLFFVAGFFLLMLLGVFGMALSGSLEQVGMQESPLSERLIKGSAMEKSKIAVIMISGMIMESEEGYIPKQIRQALKDKNVKAVVLRVDSPGGTMTGSDYYLYLLKELKKTRKIPIIVSMGSMAASGGYYVSMVGDEIFAEPTTITGSIGVIVPMYKGIGLCEKIGVESTPITSGPLKTMGSFDKPLTEEQRAVWQSLVDDNFTRFKQVIREGRPEFEADPGKLDKLATGQIYTANEAKENGLIDRIGYLDDAIEAAMKKAGLAESNSKTIRYRAKIRFMDMMLDAQAPKSILNPQTISELTLPKVYLLDANVLPLN